MATILLRGVSEGILGRGSIDMDITDGMTVSDVVRSVVTLDERLKRTLLREDGFTPRRYGTVLVDGEIASGDTAIDRNSVIKMGSVPHCDG